MRHPVKKRNIVSPDFRYNSTKVEKFINSIMWDGKKNAARKIVYGAFDIIKQKSEYENPLEVFDRAIKNVSPAMEIRSRRIGGANYTVPREVRADRKLTLAIRWVIEAVRAEKGRATSEKLAHELMAAANNEGSAVQKRTNVHKQAEANKAFAHFG